MNLQRAVVFGFMAASSVLADTWFYQGNPIYYSKFGSGPAVVQVHGIGAGASSLLNKHQIPALVAAGYQVYSPDLLGWGQSIGPERVFTARDYIDLLKAFLTEVVPGKVAIHGQSLGGAYAVAVASEMPGRINALVLNAPVGVTSFLIPPTPQSLQLFSSIVETPAGQAIYQALGSFSNIKDFCERELYFDPSKCTVPLIQDSYQYTRIPDSIYGAASFLLNNLGVDVRHAVQSLTIPVLIIWGKQNSLSSVSEGYAYQALNSMVKLVVLDGAKASVNDELSKQYNALLIEQLREIRID